MASKRIHTRAQPDPNPPEIVDNPERILKNLHKSKDPTISRLIDRANSTPENLATLRDTQVDLPFSRLPRTRSLSGIDQPDSKPPSSPQHSGDHSSSRETTPPDLHFIHNFGSSHPRTAHLSLAGPSASVIHSSTIQTTPFHPPPPFINLPLVNTHFIHNLLSWQHGMLLYSFLYL